MFCFSKFWHTSGVYENLLLFSIIFRSEYFEKKIAKKQRENDFQEIKSLKKIKDFNEDFAMSEEKPNKVDEKNTKKKVFTFSSLSNNMIAVRCRRSISRRTSWIIHSCPRNISIYDLFRGIIALGLLRN